jgi:hypothetical protein
LQKAIKGHLVPGDITGLPCPSWGLDAKLTTFLCKKIIVGKTKEVKTGWQICQNLPRRAMAQNGLFFQ